MGRRRGPRPLGQCVPYVHRNWVIGEVEPGFYEKALVEQPFREAARWLHEPTPTRLTKNPIAARSPSQCWYCRTPVKIGALIHKVRLRNGVQLRVHAACSVSPGERDETGPWTGYW